MGRSSYSQRCDDPRSALNALRAFILSDLEGGGGGPIDAFDDRSALKALRSFLFICLGGWRRCPRRSLERALGP